MSLPPPPLNDKPGSFAWLEWYRKLRDYISTSGSVPWYIINFAGSNITDIALRDHNSMQGVQGGASGEEYHLSASEHTAVAGSGQGVWSPTFTSLTEVPGGGSITKTGSYSRIGKYVYFTVQIVCTGGATTASTAGSTYCDLPITASIDDTCTVADTTTNVAIGNGAINGSTSSCYPATWGATGNTIIISGKYEV
jgi:hypothetical protein